MQPMTVQEIAAAVGGVWWNPRENAPAVTAVSTDSRRVAPGCLFLPWVGEKFDGHAYLHAALEKGADLNALFSIGAREAVGRAKMAPQEEYETVYDSILAEMQSEIDEVVRGGEEQ